MENVLISLEIRRKNEVCSLMKFKLSLGGICLSKENTLFSVFMEEGAKKVRRVEVRKL